MHDPEIDALVTGGTGFLGRWLLAELTRRGRRVVAPVRRAAARRAELGAFVASLGGDPTRLRIVEGDIEAPALGLGVDDFPRVRDVFHLAARFAFGMKRDEARGPNVEGTRRVLEWSASRPLRRFVLLGGYRLTRPPRVLEGATYPLDPAVAARLYREHGAYEASKHEALRLTRAFAAEHGLPWTAVHPSTVIGDSRTGRTIQRTGFAELLERLYAGTLAAIPGCAETFLPLVAVDHVARLLAYVPEDELTAGQELTVLDPSTPRLPQLIERSAARLGVPTPRLRAPVGLLRVLPRTITQIEPEALSFLVADRYDTASAEASAKRAAVSMPSFDETLTRYIHELVSTRFEREPAAERGAMTDGVFTIGDPDRAEYIFLHGLPWNSDVWLEVTSRLAARGEALASPEHGPRGPCLRSSSLLCARPTPSSRLGTDRADGVPPTRGHGRLDPPTARIDLPGLGRSQPAPVDDVEWLVRTLARRPRPAHLVAHSYGSYLALRAAAIRPDRVASLVLIAPAFLQPPAGLTLRLSPLVRRALAHETREGLAARVLPETSPIPHAVHSALADLRRPGVAGRTARALALASRAELRERARADLETLASRTTLVVGERDPLTIVPPPDARVITIRGAGHVPHLSHPDRVMAAFGARATNDARPHVG